jgi:serine/threonine-protein kinase CTR1
LQEVKILKRIRHPNVLFFRGICLHPPMIITELCDYGSVADVISQFKRMTAPNPTLLASPEKKAMYHQHLDWKGRVKLVLDAAKGMLYLHSKDLLHCDLKSLNLLIDSSWTCKVADFGLSRHAASFWATCFLLERVLTAHCGPRWAKR